jgi:DNA gyrase/topoisomerase IV subunit A
VEAEMEKLVKEKEQLKPMEFIPLSAFPLSGVSTTSVTEVPSMNPLTALEKEAELAKSMEEMNLQETEISRLKKEIENLQELKSSYQISLSKEKQVSDQLKQELQQLRKQTVVGKT